MSFLHLFKSKKRSLLFLGLGKKIGFYVSVKKMLNFLTFFKRMIAISLPFYITFKWGWRKVLHYFLEILFPFLTMLGLLGGKSSTFIWSCLKGVLFCNPLHFVKLLRMPERTPRERDESPLVLQHRRNPIDRFVACHPE